MDTLHAALNFYTKLDCFTVLIALTFFVIVLKIIKSCGYTYPPGPNGLPFLGILHLLNEADKRGKPMQSVMTEFSLRYGSVFSFRLGSRLVVCVSTLETTKEAFKNENICGREATLLQSIPGCPGEGIISSSGKVWRDHRRFLFGKLRKFDIGNPIYEEKLICIANNLCDIIVTHESERTFDLSKYLVFAAANSVSSVLFGKHYDFNGDELNNLLPHIRKILKFIGAGGQVFFLPQVLVKHVIYKKQYEEYKASVRYIRQTFELIVENKRRQRQIECNHVKDMIDLYLEEISENEGERSSFQIDNLLAMMGDIVCAAFDTTIQSLRWVFLYAITYTELQLRIQQELDSSIDKKGLPRRTDISKIPFTEAFLLEVQRIQTVLPMGGQHMVTDDTKVQGYDVPKGSIVLSNLWQIHHDPIAWEDPEVFRPERFLNADGKVRVPPEYIPFSTGRRSCVAEKLAKAEVLHIFTHLIHRFTFTKPDDAEDTPLIGLSGFVNEAPHYEVCAIPRL